MDSRAKTILGNLPCSIELPAGTGKTDTIVALAKAMSSRGKRTLVLTHTHAGIDAIRKRLKREGVPQRDVSVQTLDSWCFSLIRDFPLLAGIAVEEEPVWSRSEEYHLAGARAASASAVRRMLSVSYGVVAVDEYQDCQTWQHELVKSVASCVPTCVLGDRMQGLFYFSGFPVDWETEVVPAFLSIELPSVPHRWSGHNEELGEWLLWARTELMYERSVDLSRSPVNVIGRGQLCSELRKSSWANERVVAISHFPRDAANLVSRLGGDYTMIEEMEGRHLREFAQKVDTGDPGSIACDTVAFAVSCAFGVADVIESRHRKTLLSRRPISERNMEGTRLIAVQAVNRILDQPTHYSVRSALVAIANLPGFRLYRREAWNGVLEALRLCESTPELSTYDSVARVRDSLRHKGRTPESKIVGRTLLVKGLEFDHVVLDASSNRDGYNAHEFYVALTRGCKSVTIVADSYVLNPTRPRRVI